MKKNVIITALIALLFALTGSTYMSQTYRLMEFYSSETADIWVSVWYYLAQAAGIAAFMFFQRSSAKAARSKWFLMLALIAEGMAITASLLSVTQSAVVVFGLVMNLLHGLVAGWYLTLLTVAVPQKHRGKVFGFGYGVGTILSYLLSLPCGGEFLKTNTVLYAYIALCAAGILLLKFSPSIQADTDIDDTPQAPNYRIGGWLVLLIVLLSLVNTLGFYFPIGDVTSGMSWEFTRAFYALGLILAGFANDKNRRYGFICALAALICPFIMLALRSEATAAVLWIISYSFFGFFAVFRVVTFSDRSGKAQNLLWFCGLGLCAGRIGDAIGAAIGSIASDSTIWVLSIAATLFLATIALFFYLYQRLYTSNISPGEYLAHQFESFEQKYSITRRESEILHLITKG
jgi:hypothetical protein